MPNLNTVQQDIAELTPEAQQIIFNLIALLKKQPKSNQQSHLAAQKQDWSDFIGCMEAEPDLSKNYKTYLSNELEQKYANR
ncbi:MAG: hypothetical protein KGQ16_05975 [Cyanobacteria bacterium REEB444]|nr:hypothetical protein [Cyanobacteria bacterium REEB444]